MADTRPVVDLAHLARYTGGDTALNAEILRLFDMQTSEMVDQLRAILASGDAKSWKLVTHTLKGAARGVGAFSLADAAAHAEPIDLSRDRGNASEAIDTLKERSVAVQGFIRNYLAA
jgi:HPt (histidine-containing phosphotransfer) domain-containing protein